ncbi:hypothetical protein BV22DRAFT_989523, partial [Leucogyrophana mollusca]
NYSEYEEARNTLLGRPHGRAALLKGGIVSRLAREHLQESAGMDGPSKDVYQFGQPLQHQDGRLVWDDDLSTSEMDLICGLYKVPTGQGEQTADRSWWPKQSVWTGSNFDLGYWSPENERWFQDRIQQIRSGSATPLSSRNWVNSLKRYKQTSKLVSANLAAAESFLNDFFAV